MITSISGRSSGRATVTRAPSAGEKLVESVGPGRLVTGPKRPLLYVQSHHVYTGQLPVSESERERVRSENVLSLLDESR